MTEDGDYDVYLGSKETTGRSFVIGEVKVSGKGKKSKKVDKDSSGSEWKTSTDIRTYDTECVIIGIDDSIVKYKPKWKTRSPIQILSKLQCKDDISKAMWKGKKLPLEVVLDKLLAK